MEAVLQRACGGCTACCKTHAVYEIEKPAGRWCSYCRPRQGCGIYIDRPRGCCEFKCEWLKGFGEENDRPDKLKIVFDFVSFHRDFVPKLFQIWEVSGGAFRASRAKELINLSLRNGIPAVLFYASGKKEFLTGGMALSKEIKQALIAERVKIIDH